MKNYRRFSATCHIYKSGEPVLFSFFGKPFYPRFTNPTPTPTNSFGKILKLVNPLSYACKLLAYFLHILISESENDFVTFLIYAIDV